MNGPFHRYFSILVLFLFLYALMQTILPVTSMQSANIFIFIQIALGWMIQTLDINNDLDSPAYRKTKGLILRVLFSPTKHRQLLHHTIFWVIICIPLVLIGLRWVAVGVYRIRGNAYSCGQC